MERRTPIINVDMEFQPMHYLPSPIIASLGFVAIARFNLGMSRPLQRSRFRLSHIFMQSRRVPCNSLMDGGGAFDWSVVSEINLPNGCNDRFSNRSAERQSNERITIVRGSPRGVAGEFTDSWNLLTESRKFWLEKPRMGYTGWYFKK